MGISLGKPVIFYKVVCVYIAVKLGVHFSLIEAHRIAKIHLSSQFTSKVSLDTDITWNGLNRQVDICVAIPPPRISLVDEVA